MPRPFILYDFPDYTAANPWQLETVGEGGKGINVIRQTIWPPPLKIDVLHIGWEDIFLFQSKSKSHAKEIAETISNQITSLAETGVKIIWTMHNIKSHSVDYPEAEKILRDSLLLNASKIVLMSHKHLIMIPEKFREKAVVIPLFVYDVLNNAQIKNKSKVPTFFKYGAIRQETNSDLYSAILNYKHANKLVSDERLQSEIDDGNNVLVKRRFTKLEELYYGSISTFSLFTRKPCLNSGAFNYYLGCRNIIFHTGESLPYIESPEGFEIFEIQNFDSPEHMVDFSMSAHKNYFQALESFLQDRSPERIKNLWAQEVKNLL